MNQMPELFSQVRGQVYRDFSCNCSANLATVAFWQIHTPVRQCLDQYHRSIDQLMRSELITVSNSLLEGADTDV